MSGWNARKFNNPEEAVGTAQVFYQLSDPARIALEAVFDCRDGGELFSKSGKKFNVENIHRYLVKRFSPELDQDDVWDVMREIRWFIREVECDAGDPKPITAFERRRRIVT